MSLSFSQIGILISTSNNIVTTRGNYSYMAGSSGEFLVVDITDKEIPVVVGTILEFSPNVISMDVSVDENYVYCMINDEGGSFQIVDVSDKTNPNTISNFGNDTISFNPRNVQVYNSQYVLEYLIGGPTDNYIRVVDVSDPNNPVEASEAITFNYSTETIQDFRVDLENERVVVATRASGGGSFGNIYIYDFSNPLSPSLMTTISVDLDLIESVGDIKISLANDLIYSLIQKVDVGNGSIYLNIYNLTGSLLSSTLTEITTSHSIQGVDAKDNMFIILSNPFDSITLYDVSSSSLPVLAQTSSQSGWSSAFVDPYFYVSDGANLFIYLIDGIVPPDSTPAEVGDRFDYITFRKGEINNLYYYSKFGWQSSAGVYKENSTVDSDYINCTTEEYNLILLKCTEYAAEEVDEELNSVRSVRGALVFNPRYEKFNRLKKDYEKNHPSEALIMIGNVAQFVKV